MEQATLIQSKDVIYNIPLAEIFSDDEFNCRGQIAPLDVLDLAKSIQQVGLQQPIIVQPWLEIPGKYWRIVSGHRRYKACLVASLKSIKAIVHAALSEMDAAKLNLEENLKRQSLNILQEAKAIEKFFRAGWDDEKVIEELSVSKGWLQTRKFLLKLDEDIQLEAAAGFLNQEHIRQLSGMKSRAQREEAVRKIKDAKLSGDKGKIRIVKKKAPNPFAKKARDREEIFVLQETIQEACGNSFATRVLGWAAGEVADFEIHRDLKEFAEKMGRSYSIPLEMLSKL